MTDNDRARIEAQTKRQAFLAGESEHDWWVRYHKERGLPAPSEAEIAKLIELSAQDVRAGRQ